AGGRDRAHPGPVPGQAATPPGCGPPMERPMMSHDEPLLDALRSMWEAADPSPPDLATRALFRLALEDLDVEMMALQAELSGAGARGPELASTIIFESQSLAL